MIAVLVALFLSARLKRFEMTASQLDRAEKQYQQAKARLQAVKNREATKERRSDTRRKVILGGALMDLAGRDDNAAAMLDRLVRNLAREQDRKAFEGWQPGKAPAPSLAPSPAPPVPPQAGQGVERRKLTMLEAADELDKIVAPSS